MSDLSMYELEDIIWDDFDRGDDHIVPHPTNARTIRSSFEGDSCKKPRRETTPGLSDVGNLDACNTIGQGKAERDSTPLDKKKKMMEKESPSHASPVALNSSCDGEIVKDMPNLTPDDTRMSNNCFKSSYVTSGSEFCIDDRVLSGTSAAGDNNSYSYPLTHISQEEDLCFVNSNCEDKESGDLLYYGWPDIGNFEDVDKLLRNCDSSFGLGVTDNDDELGWFTSDQIGGTEEALKMDFKFPCTEPSGLNNMSLDHGSPESNNRRSSCIAGSKDEFNFKDQINLQKKQSKHQNQTEGKKARHSIGNDGPCYQIRDLKSNDSQLSSNNKSDQVITSVGNLQLYKKVDCFGHMQSNTSNIAPDYPYKITGGPMLSGIKSKHKGLKSPSPKGSSNASNQGHSMGSSGDPSFGGTAGERDVQKQAPNSQEFQPLFIGSPRQMGMMFQSSEGVLVSAEKQAHLSGKELETRSALEGVQEGAEICSINIPESSSVSSELDEISLEATSFRQLRHVMEQLDLRTRLCIRDSLYRLARSAEQRHNNPCLSGGATDVNDLGGPLMDERTDKCNGFMDMETDTNPIDRSVAHLLFHRPSESAILPAPLPLKQNVNQGSIPGPSVMEKLECQEEAAAESIDKISGD